MVTDGEILSDLVIVFGFSRRNAEIALQLFREGALDNLEEEVINRLERDAPNKENILWEKSTGRFIADHLNYRITCSMGGHAKTPSKLNRRK